MQVDKGRMRPIAKTKLEVFLTDAEKNSVYKRVFTAEAKSKQGELFPNKCETQGMYGYTIYKALTLAFESAFADISSTFNLQILMWIPLRLIILI
ncbi:MAG: hypothetical protein O6852_06680 [Gammaproteobacteria bacterium]|nr:hypothetical protein [Gammaproteobacteria bacterium]